MTDKFLLPEEILARLREAGISPETWKELEEKSIRLPMADRQAELLGKLRNIFEQNLAEKQAELASLKETLVKIRHGGGR